MTLRPMTPEEYRKTASRRTREAQARYFAEAAREQQDDQPADEAAGKGVDDR